MYFMSSLMTLGRNPPETGGLWWESSDEPLSITSVLHMIVTRGFFSYTKLWFQTRILRGDMYGSWLGESRYTHCVLILLMTMIASLLSHGLKLLMPTLTVAPVWYIYIYTLLRWNFELCVFITFNIESDIVFVFFCRNVMTGSYGKRFHLYYWQYSGLLNWNFYFILFLFLKKYCTCYLPVQQKSACLTQYITHCYLYILYVKFIVY